MDNIAAVTIEAGKHRGLAPIERRGGHRETRPIAISVRAVQLLTPACVGPSRLTFDAERRARMSEGGRPNSTGPSSDVPLGFSLRVSLLTTRAPIRLAPLGALFCL